MHNINNHQRVNDILLGPLERPALKWLAGHMPTWMTPDILTWIGVLGAIITMVGYMLSNRSPVYLWLAILGFVINWFGDSLDGTLARYRHIERPVYGFYIDHTVDEVCQVMIFVGLGASPYVTFNVACLTLVAYMLMTVLAYVRTCVVGEFRISYGKLGPTEVRVLAILLTTSMYFGGIRTFQIKLGALGGLTMTPYDVVVAFIGLLICYFFVTTAVKQGWELRNVDRSDS
jgi:archaetidylinositol phosphate synthase